jgi:hypothetical protein
MNQHKEKLDKIKDFSAIPLQINNRFDALTNLNETLKPTALVNEMTSNSSEIYNKKDKDSISIVRKKTSGKIYTGDSEW